MRKKDSLIQIFAEIDEEGREIHYYKGSWEGPKVTPRRFYPSKLVNLVSKKAPNETEYIPDQRELIHNAPEDERIIEQDFLEYTNSSTNLITIGNPPFGSRSKLAIDFFNKAATMSNVIAFIVPVSFMKWSV